MIHVHAEVERSTKTVAESKNMNIYESAEDYLERILILRQKQEKVISLDVALSMNYSKASISRAMKNLRENGYITVDTDGSLELTELGFKIANRVFERHKMLSEIFIKIGVPEKIALKDACKVEHDLSDETFDAIKKIIEKEKN